MHFAQIIAANFAELYFIFNTCWGEKKNPGLIQFSLKINQKIYFRVSCPSRLPGISSIPLPWQLPTLAHPHCWPQISSSWCKADHCRLCPWVYTWAVGSILIQIVSVPLRNKKGEHNTRAAELSVLIRATHHLLWLGVLSALKRLRW